ncbi:hypothetical protein AB9T88_02705 [Flavobacterium sp. LBUM151]
MIFKEIETLQNVGLFDVERVKSSESLFSIGNGAMGQRANFEETYSGETFHQTATNSTVEELINGGYVNVYFDFNSSKPTNASLSGVDFFSVVINWRRSSLSSTTKICDFSCFISLSTGSVSFWLTSFSASV